MSNDKRYLPSNIAGGGISNKGSSASQSPTFEDRICNPLRLLIYLFSIPAVELTAIIVVAVAVAIAT